MMESDFLEALVSTGVGGLLAALMFYFYRLDSNAWTSRWERATRDAEQSRDLWMQVVRDNTEAIAGLKAEMRQRRNGNSADRRNP